MCLKNFLKKLLESCEKQLTNQFECGNINKLSARQWAEGNRSDKKDIENRIEKNKNELKKQ